MICLKSAKSGTSTSQTALTTSAPEVHTFPELKLHGCAKAIEYIITEAGCWECVSHFVNTRNPKFGFVPIHRGGKDTSLHRYVFLKTTEHPLDKNDTVSMTCRNPSCMNFAHMKLGTSKYPRSLKRRKLTMRQAKRVRALHADGKSVVALSVRFDVSKSTIYNILRGRTYKPEQVSDQRMSGDKNSL